MKIARRRRVCQGKEEGALQVKEFCKISKIFFAIFRIYTKMNKEPSILGIGKL
jgi:hypothetical protein